ncbi:MAG: pyridoxamine 5'-phosphate oxidase family protein [Mycobacteriaceae bacterium]|nr:pyridoxamine 5'-phosphate oxidase family protein [Mycobacteriaceae bacterium]
MSPTAAARDPDRVTHDRDTAYAILDEALAVHVGFDTDDGPVVIATMHVRDGDRLLLHGAANGRLLATLATGIPLCVTATLISGRSSYRSVKICGRAAPIDERDERAAALSRTAEAAAPGRPAACRRTVLSMPIEEFSVKIRTSRTTHGVR